MTKTPSLHGFRMPAEWEPHSRIWLSWPHLRSDWPGKFEPLPWVFAEIARHITSSERLGLFVKDAAALRQAKVVLKRANVDVKKIDFLVRPTNRGWMRDCGATFVIPAPAKSVRGQAPAGIQSTIALDWKFNGWAKYSNFPKDNALAKVMAHHQNIRSVKPVHNGRHVVLEGGAIDVNGHGTLITTEECLLSRKQCRNPGFTRDDYETVFANYLGIKNVIWLDKGIVGDDTHGHVDDLTRFVNRDTVVTVIEKNRRDKNYSILQNNLKRLKKARIETGKPLTILELPMPQPVIFDGQILPASYANFLITNQKVLVPVFNDPADIAALNVLSAAFPRRNVVGIFVRDLVWGLGTIHCLTQQQPSGY